MSNSVLYHTFGVLGVQYRKTDFLTVRPSFMAALAATAGSITMSNVNHTNRLINYHKLLSSSPEIELFAIAPF